MTNFDITQELRDLESKKAETWMLTANLLELLPFFATRPTIGAYIEENKTKLFNINTLLLLL